MKEVLYMLGISLETSSRNRTQMVIVQEMDPSLLSSMLSIHFSICGIRIP